MTTSRAASGALLVALAATSWGFWPLFLRPSGLTGYECAFVVLGVMALPAPFLILRRRVADRGARVALLVVGLADTLNCVLYFGALQRGPVAIAVLTHYLAPLLVTLLAPVLIAEARSRRASLAAPLSLLALALVIGRPDFTSGAGLTALLGAGSAVGYAAIVLATRRASRAFLPVEITSFHAVISLVALTVGTGGAAIPSRLDASLLPVLVGSAICGLLANVVFNVGLGRVGSQVSGALTYLEPLSASIVGWVVWQERLGPAQLLGGVVLLGLGAWVALEPAPALRLAPTREAIG